MHKKQSGNSVGYISIIQIESKPQTRNIVAFVGPNRILWHNKMQDEEQDRKYIFIIQI